MKVFIVVLNWNQEKLTMECIESLQKLKLEKSHHVEIVVVDNGSGEILSFRPSMANVKLIKNNKNLGFAGGNNVGIKFALDNFADYILILNNDTIVDSNLIAELLKPMDDKRVAITSPKIYFAKGYEFHKEKYTKNQLGKVIWYAGGKIDWRNVYGENIGVDEVDKNQYDKEEEIDFATGACFLVSAKALKEVGLFDEKYFMYMEDMDLSLRLKKNGWMIIYEPKAKLWHKVAQSSSIGSDLNDYFISRNRLLFGVKYADLRTKFALFRESIKLFIFGRHYQAVGIRDYYLRKFGKGSWG
jgi:GT2 family glycosyltransferase